MITTNKIKVSFETILLNDTAKDYYELVIPDFSKEKTLDIEVSK